MTSIDEITNEVTLLYNPRTDLWENHFVIDCETGRIEPRGARGRVTVYLLDFNNPRRVQERIVLIQLNRYPPDSPSNSKP